MKLVCSFISENLHLCLNSKLCSLWEGIYCMHVWYKHHRIGKHTWFPRTAEQPQTLWSFTRVFFVCRWGRKEVLLEARIPGSSSASRCPVRLPFIGATSSLKVCDFKGINSPFFHRFSYVIGGLVSYWSGGSYFWNSSISFTRIKTDHWYKLRNYFF